MSRKSDNFINFTKILIESLPLPQGDKRCFFYDVRGNGLYVAVTQNGRKSFYIRRQVDGKNEKHFLGGFPDLSIEQAREKAAKFAGAIAYGDNPAERHRLLRGEYSLKEMFDDYLNRHLQKSRKTAIQNQENFDRYFGDWKERKLSTISQMDVERRHQEIGRDRGTYAANRALQLIRAVYNKAIAWRIYSGMNPACGITLFAEHSRERVIEDDEFERFFRQLDREESEDFRDFVMLALLTGARKSNVLSMSWVDVNLKNGTWRIAGEKSKNGRTQVIALTEAEKEILERRSITVRGDYVFPSNSKAGHLLDVKNSWASFLKRAEIRNLQIHDLRRSMASSMANTGSNLSVIRSALNHKDLKTTLSVYARANQNAELFARKRAQARMLELGSVRVETNVVQFRVRH